MHLNKTHNFNLQYYLNGIKIENDKLLILKVIPIETPEKKYMRVANAKQ